MTAADAPDFFKKVVLPWVQQQKIARTIPVAKPLATYLAHEKERMEDPEARKNGIRMGVARMAKGVRPRPSAKGAHWKGEGRMEVG